ncbi:MAG TPA: hypothetical protein VGC36_03025 [Rhizomicrobium sp.]
MPQDEFFERAPLAEREKPGWQTWAVRGGAVVVALAAVVAILQVVTVEPSWHRAGFASDPGSFVRKHDVDYAVCAPWQGWSAAKPLSQGYRVATITAQPLPARGTTTNYGVLLPNDSKIAAIYCGSSNGGAVSECSPEGCDAPVVVQLDDDIHTKQRALSVSLEGKEGKPRPERILRLWVLWRT